MKCHYHPEVDAVATCMDCGRAICQSCAVNVAGRPLCRQCLASDTAIRSRAESVPTNPLAIVSLILGILGLLGCACGGSIGRIPVSNALKSLRRLPEAFSSPSPSNASKTREMVEGL